MQKMEVYLVLAYQNNQLFHFISEFARLIEKKAFFILRWNQETRVFIDSCKGLQEDSFVCVDEDNIMSNKNAVTVINYSICKQCNIDIKINNSNYLVFEIFSEDEKIELIKKFKEDLFSLSQD